MNYSSNTTASAHCCSPLRTGHRDMSEKCIRWQAERVTLPPKFWFVKLTLGDTLRLPVGCKC